MSFQVGVGAFHWSLRGKGFRTRGGAFRSSSDPGEGTRAPGASWASLAATTRIRPGFAMSSATRAASFPEMRCCFILVSYSGRRHQGEKSSTAQHVMNNRRHCLTYLLHKSPRIPQQLRNLAPARDCFSRIVSVLEGILVTLWGARRHPPGIRQGPFGIAADRQRLPLLVRARSRCASATVGGLELFGRPSPIIRLRPGSKECEVSKFCAALLPQLMFVCLLARLRAEPKHPLPMHNQTKLTVAVIAVSHNRSSGFLNEETPVPCSSPRVLS